MIAFLLLLSMNASGAVCSTKYKAPEEYEKLKALADQKIEAFANKKGVAEKADDTLSKLIEAKSPFVKSWLNKRGLKDASEEKIAKAWREYFARNFVLTSYPQPEKGLNAEIEKLVNSITAEFIKKPFQDRMQKLFEKAKKGTLDTVTAMALSDEDKGKITKRIKSIELYWPKDFKTARNNQIPLDIISWGIAYDPEPNGINMGLNSLSYPNDETYLAVFAHEIGHSIDSCRWSSYIKGTWPFEKVGACLRSDKNVGAKTRDDQFLARLVVDKKISPQLAQSLKDNPTCNKIGYPPGDAQADQLPESFADWFSAEVIASLKVEDVAKVRMDLCESHDLQAGTSYLPNEKRLRMIYFSQPALKAKANDPSLEKNTYCSLNGA